MQCFWKRNRGRLAQVFLFCVGDCVAVVALTTSQVKANEPQLATATFVVVSDGQDDERGESKGPQANQPLQSCFVFVPPSDAPTFIKHPQMRRWLDTHREQRDARLHKFRLEAGKILPTAAVLRVGDSVYRWLNSDFPLSLETLSNPPIGPGPAIIRNYTFEHSEILPIRISAASQAAATSHALVLDHGFGAASGRDGKVVISGLPTGIDIPMRISLPAATDRISFQSDTLAIERNGRFAIRLDGDSQFRIAISQAVRVRNRETGTIENALGMKFVPVAVALPGGQAKTIYIQQAEVTHEKYRRFKVAAGLTTTQAESIPSDQPLAPQDFDCWDVAAKFIAQLNRWDKKYTYRMPTEDEWEFACTGRVGEPPVSQTVCEDRGNTNRWTRQSEPNRFGLHDMLGVYGEYCSDLYNRNDDPALRVIAEGKDARVVRGMRQNTDKPGCYRYASDYRFPVATGCRQTPHLVIGVRLVLEPRLP